MSTLGTRARVRGPGYKGLGMRAWVHGPTYFPQNVGTVLVNVWSKISEHCYSNATSTPHLEVLNVYCVEFYIQPSLVNFQSVIKLMLSDFELSKSPSQPSCTLLNSVSMVLDHIRGQTLSAEVDTDLRNLRCHEEKIKESEKAGSRWRCPGSSSR